jgi:SAM-dependent methyltransferase
MFEMVLCPYSLVTYMVAADDVARMLHEIRDALKPDGTVIIDAFIPQRDTGGEEFRVDHRREQGNTVLTLCKRVTAMGPRRNRIERHYELVAADGNVLEDIDTNEDIRLFTPEDLLELLPTSGFEVDATWWDYASGEPKPGAQFFTVSARKGTAALRSLASPAACRRLAAQIS